jgi:D-alanyl-D-alanine dipeptidase
LTLRWKGGDPLWMGSLFDDVTALANRDFFEEVSRPDGEPVSTSPGRRSQGFSYSDQEAQANRRLLHWLMVEEGFAGHPDEWWHFSWGDQMWAAIMGADAAHYGLADVTSG